MANIRTLTRTVQTAASNAEAACHNSKGDFSWLLVVPPGCPKTTGEHADQRMSMSWGNALTSA
jgi:hypothetical protein